MVRAEASPAPPGNRPGVRPETKESGRSKSRGGGSRLGSEIRIRARRHPRPSVPGRRETRWGGMGWAFAQARRPSRGRPSYSHDGMVSAEPGGNGPGSAAVASHPPVRRRSSDAVRAGASEMISSASSSNSDVMARLRSADTPVAMSHPIATFPMSQGLDGLRSPIKRRHSFTRKINFPSSRFTGRPPLANARRKARGGTMARDIRMRRGGPSGPTGMPRSSSLGQESTPGTPEREAFRAFGPEAKPRHDGVRRTVAPPRHVGQFVDRPLPSSGHREPHDAPAATATIRPEMASRCSSSQRLSVCLNIRPRCLAVGPIAFP